MNESKQPPILGNYKVPLKTIQQNTAVNNTQWDGRQSSLWVKSFVDVYQDEVKVKIYCSKFSVFVITVLFVVVYPFIVFADGFTRPFDDLKKYYRGDPIYTYSIDKNSYPQSYRNILLHCNLHEYAI